jgi:hypothetical protein
MRMMAKPPALIIEERVTGRHKEPSTQSQAAASTLMQKSFHKLHVLDHESSPAESCNPTGLTAMHALLSVLNGHVGM